MTDNWQPDIDSHLEQDWFDRRDLTYSPSLRPLTAGTRTSDFLRDLGALKASFTHPSGRLRIPLRNQGRSATCTGQALAALIDILQTIRAPDQDHEPVSARMLYVLGREVEGRRMNEGIQNLRSVLKGFWHNGVCPKPYWEDEGEDGYDGDSLTVERAKAARAVTLSSYFRVRTLLNDFHSAISEAGAILVSAQIHQGWSSEAIRRTKGVIDNPPNATGEGVHAFVVCGWDEEGFLVLNSAGPDWGGWNGLPGIARWSYQDWSERVLDAWVLQLGASTPRAFDMCHCPQGLFGGALSIEEARSPRIPRSHLVGHYAHLSDSRHVETGTYPSSRLDVDNTVNLLRQKNSPAATNVGPLPKREPLVLWLAGGIEGMESAIRNAKQRKAFFEKEDFYFYTVLWCQDVIDAAKPVLGVLFDLAAEKSGKEGHGAVETMEAVIRGIGRAVWRDLHHAAQRAARNGAEPGDARHLLSRALSGDLGPVHIVADGLGAILLAALLADSPADAYDALAGLVLVAPAIKLSTFKSTVASAMKTLPPGKSAIILPSADFERRLVTGPYPRSLLHLAANAFEEPEHGVPPVMAGTHEAFGRLRKLRPAIALPLIKPPPKPLSLEHSDLTTNKVVLDIILKILKEVTHEEVNPRQKDGERQENNYGSASRVNVEA